MIDELQLERHCDTDIKIIGDKTTNTQVVMLLAFLRDAIQSNKETEIKVTVGKHMKNRFFAMQVNGEEIPQIIAEKEIEIN